MGPQTYNFTRQARHILDSLSHDERDRMFWFLDHVERDPSVTKKNLESGNFVSEFGDKRVVWRRDADGNILVLTIFDKSFLY